MKKHRNRCRKSIARLHALPSKSERVAANRYLPKEYSGSMRCRLGDAKLKSPFAVVHIGIRAAGSSDNAAVSRMKQKHARMQGATQRFAKRAAKQEQH